MSKAKIEPKQYTQWEIDEFVRGLINTEHNELARTEKLHGKRFYETFGEWKKMNPHHPVAKRNYPEDEYVMVISNHLAYFNRAAEAAEATDVKEIDF